MGVLGDRAVRAFSIFVNLHIWCVSYMENFYTDKKIKKVGLRAMKV